MSSSNSNKPKPKLSPFAVVCAAAVASYACMLMGCGGKANQPYVGMKVSNWSPYPITANYSLVDPATGNSDGGDHGSITIPSMWNYTSGEPIPDAGDHYRWLAWPMQENQNYTAKLVIGNDVSRIEAYMTAFVQDPGSDVSRKCEDHDNEEDQKKCMDVSAVQTQFQIAFPYISLAYLQEFDFNCTSAGSYQNAGLGYFQNSHCSAASCSGLGIATRDADGKMNYRNNVYALMPQIELNKNSAAGAMDSFTPKVLTGKEETHNGAIIPTFTFTQTGAAPGCDGTTANGDISCQALKTQVAAGDLTATAAKCVNATCVFEPGLFGGQTCDASDTSICGGDIDKCQLDGLADKITCDAPDAYCAADQCRPSDGAKRADSFCAVDANTNLPGCASFCSLFQTSCPDVIFDMSEGGSGNIRSDITKAINDNDFEYLDSDNMKCNGRSVASRLLWNDKNQPCPNQIAFNDDSQTCTVTNTWQCPTLTPVPSGYKSQTCPSGSCTQTGGCDLKKSPACEAGYGYKGQCENTQCTDGVDKSTGYCSVPAGCHLASGVTHPTKSSDIICVDVCAAEGVCGGCGKCTVSTSDPTKYTCSMPASDTCGDSSKCVPAGNKFNCQSWCFDNSDCGVCGTCDQTSGTCVKADKADDFCGCGECQVQSDELKSWKCIMTVPGNYKCQKPEDKDDLLHGCGQCMDQSDGSFKCAITDGVHHEFSDLCTQGNEKCAPNPSWVNGSTDAYEFTCQETEKPKLGCANSDFNNAHLTGEDKCGSCGTCNPTTGFCEPDFKSGTCETSSTGKCVAKEISYRGHGDWRIYHCEKQSCNGDDGRNAHSYCGGVQSGAAGGGCGVCNFQTGKCMADYTMLDHGGFCKTVSAGADDTLYAQCIGTTADGDTSPRYTCVAQTCPDSNSCSATAGKSCGKCNPAHDICEADASMCSGSTSSEPYVCMVTDETANPSGSGTANDFYTSLYTCESPNVNSDCKNDADFGPNGGDCGVCSDGKWTAQGGDDFCYKLKTLAGDQEADSYTCQKGNTAVSGDGAWMCTKGKPQCNLGNGCGSCGECVYSIANGFQCQKNKRADACLTEQDNNWISTNKCTEKYYDGNSEYPQWQCVATCQWGEKAGSVSEKDCGVGSGCNICQPDGSDCKTQGESCTNSKCADLGLGTVVNSQNGACTCPTGSSNPSGTNDAIITEQGYMCMCIAEYNQLDDSGNAIPGTCHGIVVRKLEPGAADGPDVTNIGPGEYGGAAVNFYCNTDKNTFDPGTGECRPQNTTNCAETYNKATGCCPGHTYDKTKGTSGQCSSPAS